MQPSELQIAFREATCPNGLIELLETLRKPDEKYKTKKDTIYAIFSNCPLWEEEKTKSGHVKFKHKITQVVIGYQNHGDSKLDPGGAVTLLDEVQKHLNILCNRIFMYERNHWKYEPNWAQAEQNLALWRQNNPIQN